MWVLGGAGRPRGAVLREWLIVQLGIVIAYAPWLPSLLFQFRQAGYSPVTGLVWGSLLPFYARLLSGLPDPFAGLAILFLLGVIAWQARKGSAIRTSERRLALMLLVGVPLVAITAATALSFRGNLIIHRCVLMLTPCMLLALGFGIELTAASRRSIVPATLTAGIVAISGIQVGDLLSQVRSNAREVAAAVAAQVRPTDLLVIAPEWLASSFNFYFKPDTPQISFPHQGREGAIRWDDLAARTADPQSYEQTKSRLSAARRARQRVWLVTEMDELQRSQDARIPVQDEALATVPRNDWQAVATVRLAQILVQLEAAYGTPNSSAVPILPDLTGDERLIVLLFDAEKVDAPSPAR
jgi:hypothetical protein